MTVKSADEPSLMLSRYGEHLYDNLVLLCPGVEEFGGSLSVEVRGRGSLSVEVRRRGSLSVEVRGRGEP